MRNIDTTLSELTMIVNLNIVDDEMRHTNFKMGYNLGKNIVRKAMVIEESLNEQWRVASSFVDVTPILEDIIDDKELDFSRLIYDNSSQ